MSAGRSRRSRPAHQGHRSCGGPAARTPRWRPGQPGRHSGTCSSRRSACLAIPGVDAQPLLGRHSGDQVLGSDLSGAVLGHRPQRLGALDRHDVADGVGFQPHPQAAVAAVDVSPVTHPNGTPAASARSSMAWPSCGLVLKVTSSGTPATWSAPGRRSRIWAVQVPVDQRHPTRCRISRSPAPGSSRRRRCRCTGVGPRPSGHLLHKAGLVQHQYRAGVAPAAPRRTRGGRRGPRRRPTPSR